MFWNLEIWQFDWDLFRGLVYVSIVYCTYCWAKVPGGAEGQDFLLQQYGTLDSVSKIHWNHRQGPSWAFHSLGTVQKGQRQQGSLSSIYAEDLLQTNAPSS